MTTLNLAQTGVCYWRPTICGSDSDLYDSMVRVNFACLWCWLVPVTGISRRLRHHLPVKSPNRADKIYSAATLANFFRGCLLCGFDSWTVPFYFPFCKNELLYFLGIFVVSDKRFLWGGLGAPRWFLTAVSERKAANGFSVSKVLSQTPACAWLVCPGILSVLLCTKFGHVCAQNSPNYCQISLPRRYSSFAYFIF